MNRQRGILLGMILVQAAATAVLTETRLFPLLAGASACLAFFMPLSKTLSMRQRFYGLAALFLLLSLKMRLFPLDFPNRFSPFPNNYELNHVFAQGLLIVQIVMLAAHRFEQDRETPRLSWGWVAPLLGAVQLGAVTDFVSQSRLHHQASVLCTVLFTALFAAYIFSLTTTHTRFTTSYLRAAVSLGVLAAALLSGMAFASVAAPVILRLDVFFFQMMRPPVNSRGVGVPERSTLQSVTNARDANTLQVVLRIRAEGVPDYLRMSVSDRFDGRTWQSTASAVPMTSVQAPDTAPGDALEDHFFVLRPNRAAGPAQTTLWPATPMGRMATTLDTALLATRLPGIEADSHLAVKSDALLSGQPYRLFHGPVTHKDTPEDRLLENCLQVPDTLTPEARSICETVLAGKTSTEEKIRAVRDFFLKHFNYALGISLPPGADPVSHFLTERPPAHCEYFATAAALMLRTGGIPCRYVVGYAVSEKNTGGDYWLARNRDAHAWVEAWDAERGWIIVEATPPDGLPQTPSPGALALWWDVIKFRASVLMALIREHGVAFLALALAAIGNWLANSWAGRLLLALGLTTGLVYLIRHRPFRRKSVRLSDDEKHYARMTAAVDRMARQRGFYRKPHVTMTQFAQMLRTAEDAGPWHAAVAAWYETCAQVRFDGTPPKEGLHRLSQLRQAMAEIPKNSRS